MNKIIKSTKSHIESQKMKYIFLISITLIGIITGIIFIFFISSKDKSLIEKEFEVLFNSIKKHDIKYLSTFINGISSSLLVIILIYLFGISIIGIPIITFILFIKGYIFGFSIASLINIYNFKGLLIALSYLFPSHIILLIIYMLISFHAISFSIKLFRYLFLKENINLGKYFKNLCRIFIICLIGCIICSSLETFLTPILIDLSI